MNSHLLGKRGLNLYTEAGLLTPTAPFDFDQSLKFLRGFGPTKNEQTVSPGSLTKAVCIDGQAVVFQIISTGTTEEPRLAYTLLFAQPVGESTKNAVAERMIFFLSLQDDLRPFYRFGRADPHFSLIVDRLHLYHHVSVLAPGG